MANPTAREQELLELINRMRANPTAELPLLLNSADPQVINSLKYFKVDRTLLATQWSTLVAAAPLAWSSQLNDVAVAHNQKMIQYDQQSHDVGVYDSLGNFTAYEPSFTGRFAAVNYNFSNVGENIFAYAESTLAAHQAWAIDWGGTAATGGIQNPAGHRDNMMSSNFREAGFSITDETNPNTQVGPLVVTGEFGNRNALNGKSWLLGVAFKDTNKDGWYEAGEGLSDVQVQITGINGTTFSDTLTVSTAGGYQDLLNPGQYKIDFSRNGVVISSKTTLISATPTNIKIDLVLPLTAPARNDFNGDGKSDILWQNDSGSVALWQMNGATVTSGSLTSVPNIDASWKTAGTGDFNGDGKSDILWRNTNGSVALWTMDGATVKSSNLTSTPSIDNSWKAAGTGDYNGDGKADILWRNTNGSIALWTMDGATVKSSSLTSTPSLDNSWKVASNSDFNGDGKADILWRNDDGSVALWQMNGAGVTASTAVAKVSTDWKIAGTGDFDGDGKADILWRNDNNGSIALWQMDGATLVAGNKTSTPSLDSSWNVAGIGDYNGDGKSDILWRNAGGAAVVWTMNGATVAASALTSATADGGWKIAAPII